MSIDSILNVILFILTFIFLYLLITRVLMKNQPTENEYKREVETATMQTREAQVSALLTENKLYQDQINKTLEKYRKKKIKAAEYKQTVKDLEEQIAENDTRIRELQIENDEDKNKK